MPARALPASPAQAQAGALGAAFSVEGLTSSLDRSRPLHRPKLKPGVFWRFSGQLRRQPAQALRDSYP